VCEVRSAAGGVSAGWSFEDGWLPEYPETAGYIIEASSTPPRPHTMLGQRNFRSAMPIKAPGCRQSELHVGKCS
jgi:hypothetical protein